MASPTLVHVHAEAADDTQPPESPALNALDIQASYPDQMANTPAVPILRVLDLQAVNVGAGPLVTPILRVLDITTEEGPPPPDYLPPADVVYGTIEATQVNGNPQGRTQITLNFPTVTTSQVTPGEWLGVATGGSQTFYVRYYPVKAP